MSPGDDDKIIKDAVSETQTTDDDEKKYNIEFIESPHKSKRTAAIDTIVIHYTAANRISSTINWFKDPRAKVSAHYVIGRDGRIVQMVKDELKAWHAGKSYFRGRRNVNNFSIGFEMVGTRESGYTEEQYRSCVYVCSLLYEKYDISLDNIVGHEDVSGDEAVKLGIRTESNKKIDPGPKWDWGKFHQYFAELMNTSIVDDEPEPVEDKDNNVNLYTPDVMMESGVDPVPTSQIMQLIKFFMSWFGYK